MINARYLSQIAVIADLGSISRAAEHLNVTQPTLSRTVRIVEDSVGITTEAVADAARKVLGRA